MIRCDMCGGIEPYKESYFVQFYKRSEPDKGYLDCRVDLCDACRDEIVTDCCDTPVTAMGETAREQLENEVESGGEGDG